MRHVIDCAVSLGFLLDFAAKVPDGYSTADVVEQIVIPSTTDDRCRYVALRTVPEGAVGRSQFFISHRWAADFVKELVALIASRFADTADAANAGAAVAAAACSSSPPGKTQSQGSTIEGGCSSAAYPQQSPSAKRHQTTSVTVALPLGDAGASLGTASPGSVQASIAPSSPCPTATSTTTNLAPRKATSQCYQAYPQQQPQFSTHSMRPASREDSGTASRRPSVSAPPPPLPRPPHTSSPSFLSCQPVVARASSRLRAGRDGALSGLHANSSLSAAAAVGDGASTGVVGRIGWAAPASGAGTGPGTVLEGITASRSSCSGCGNPYAHGPAGDEGAAGAAAAVSATFPLAGPALPGSAICDPYETGWAGGAATVVAAAVAAAATTSREGSFSASLNPLNARPACPDQVFDSEQPQPQQQQQGSQWGLHSWPHRPFGSGRSARSGRSDCLSRRSSMRLSTGGGGGGGGGAGCGLGCVGGGGGFSPIIGFNPTTSSAASQVALSTHQLPQLPSPLGGAAAGCGGGGVSGGSGGSHLTSPLSPSLSVRQHHHNHHHPPPYQMLLPHPSSSATSFSSGAAAAAAALAGGRRASRTASGMLIPPPPPAAAAASTVATAAAAASTPGPGAVAVAAGGGYGGGSRPASCRAAAAATSTSAPVTVVDTEVCSGAAGISVSEASDVTPADTVGAVSSGGSGTSSTSRSCSVTSSSRRPTGRRVAGTGGGVRGGSRMGTCSTTTTMTNADVVAAVRRRFAGREGLLAETFVWLDIFAINQHPNTTQAGDLSKLQDVVGASEATLLVCDRGGQVLTRIWCLYEIWQTVRQRGPKALQVLAGRLDFADLERVWGDLDVERAQATVDSDRVRILADIRATTGSEGLDRHIKRAVVESATHDLGTARATAPHTPTHGERALRAAVLLRASGAAAAALAAAREAAEVYDTCRGPTHGDTLQALRTVAGCHKDLGAARQALGLLEQQVIPFLDEAYGTGHTEYDALTDAGMLQYTLGQYDKAYDSLLLALSQQLRRLLLVSPPHAAAQLTAVLSAAGAAAAAATTTTTTAVSTSSGVHGGVGTTGSLACVAAPATFSSHLFAPSAAALSGDHLTSFLAGLQAAVGSAREELDQVDAATEAPAGKAPVEEGKKAVSLATEAVAVAAAPAPGPAVSGNNTASESSGGGKGIDSTCGGPGSTRGCSAAVASVRQQEDEFGAAAERVGLTLNSLGLVQKERAARCRTSEGAALLREARELMEASVGLLEQFSGSHRGMGGLDARSNLAGLVMEGGDYQSAEALLRSNLALTESVYGRDHPHTATALNNLAMCLKRQRSSRPDKGLEAEALYRRCLALCRSSLGEDHLETLVVATNLGVLLADQRQWSESEALLTRAVASLDPSSAAGGAALGPAHPDVLAAHRRLAEVLELRNKLFEAEAMFRLTLQYAEAAPPDVRDHGLVLECREGLARVQGTMEVVAAAARGQAELSCCIVS